MFPTVCWPAGRGINPSIQAHTHQQSSRSCTRSSATGEAAGQKWDSSAPRYCTTALPVMAGMELREQCPLQPLIPDNSQKGPFHHLWRVQTSSAHHNLSASSSCAVRGMPALALSLCPKKMGGYGLLEGKIAGTRQIAQHNQNIFTAGHSVL